MATGILLLRQHSFRAQTIPTFARQFHSTPATKLRPRGSAAATHPIAISHTRNYSIGPAAAAAKPSPARTRFAPSPTGLLHLGSLRTALFNYLYAKHTGGQFLLRIEDTDQKRTLEGAEQRIYETLRWAGLQWDEGPEVGGPFGPYRQSERTELHREHAHILVKAGHAYRCFCSHDRLANLALQRARQNIPTDYDRTCTHISAEESEERAHKGETHVIRLKAPDDYPVFNDLLYGAIQYGSNKPSHNQGSYTDPVILKSDGLPTYHLANVVDDHFMEITHVIRALEWMPSTPRHVYMYNCFGWTPPAFAHVGLLQNEAKKKLSKRDGDVNVESYAEKGYLPEALNNFVALLGWSHSRQDDVMTMRDLIDEFSLNHLTVGNTIVTFGKLAFLQKAHVRLALGLDEPPLSQLPPTKESKSDGESPSPPPSPSPSPSPTTTLPSHPIITSLVRTLHAQHPTFDQQYIERCIATNLKNYVLPDQFIPTISHFFANSTASSSYLASPPTPAAKSSIEVITKHFKKLSSTPTSAPTQTTLPSLLLPLVKSLTEIPHDDWSTTDKIKHVFPHAPDKKSHPDDFQNHTILMRFLRLALAGGQGGASMPDTLAALGKARALARLREAVGVFSHLLQEGGGVGEEVVRLLKPYRF